MTLRVAIVGGSGYVGGELLRLLTFHPDVEVSQVTSGSRAGHYVHSAHPNLRGAINLRFSDPDDLQACDVLFLALPHGQVARDIERYAALAKRVIDCSADFRLHDPADYARWYGQEHPAPQWLDRFVYGLPERERTALRQTRYASGVGCNAAGTILALGPLADAGWLEEAVVEIKVGSSEAGAQANASSHHPERAGVVRVYAPTGHRHLAEIRQALGNVPVHLSVTAIEMVRGVHVTAHAFLRKGRGPDDERDVWALYREAYADEPFIRLVNSKQGLYRYPEPKILAGTNFCDIGFALDAETGRLVVIAALDNMMKGAAGSAVQSMNVMCGLDEQAGLTFPGLHPI
jgi:N-acetyl-gamma-glutamyl-phosphate/LysW-gamma-L-alpha-aminoadipyl-6-phosphate reductase